jgi:hypothetical protein
VWIAPVDCDSSLVNPFRREGIVYLIDICDLVFSIERNVFAVGSCELDESSGQQKQYVNQDFRERQERIMSRAKRKQNYVDSHVQGALLRRICIHWVIFFGVAAVSIIMLQSLLGDPSQTLAQRIQVEVGEFMLIGIVMLSLFPAFLLDTIRFSNRFVGPITRLRRFLRDLKNGKTEKCAFRGSDFWNEMATEFNDIAAMVENQRTEIAALKEQLETAKA